MRRVTGWRSAQGG